MRQYDSTKVTASWTTNNPILGTIDALDARINGTFASITKDNKRWIREMDGNGNGTRVFLPNRGASLDVILSGSSPANKVLSRAVQIDDEEQNVVGVLVLEDLSGGTSLTLEGAFLDDFPDPDFATETRGERTWTFQCERLILRVTGHNNVGDTDQTDV